MAQITKAPAEVLRKPALLVEKIDKRILRIIDSMTKTLLAQKDPEGVGLAAPQIGEPLRIFLIRPITKGDAPSEPKLFINPEITNLSRDTIKPKSKGAMLEGCLSMPYYYGHVNRSKNVTVKYQTVGSDSQLLDKTETFSGFPAQIVQHEFDHLNGILFIDRILEQNGKLFEIRGEDWKRVDI